MIINELRHENMKVCFATVRNKAENGNQLIAFHDSPPEPVDGVSVVRARVLYATNGNVRFWEILPNTDSAKSGR